MKKWLIALGIAGLLAGAATPWGITAISYLLIPPERGWFRYYETVTFRQGEYEQYWWYWQARGNVVAAGSPRDRRSDEEWELVRETGRRYFIYDERDEFDGLITFTRTAMLVQHLDGSETSYPRVLDLWEIWREGAKTAEDRVIERPLASRRSEHRVRILARMRERHLATAPDAGARRRPPTRGLPPPVPPPASPPLFAVTEFGYGDNTGTTLVIYADGLVVCRALPENSAAPFHSFRVPDAARLVQELEGGDFARQPERVILSEGTDQKTTTVWTPQKRVAVYGPWPKPYLQENDPDDPDPRVRDENESEWIRWAARVMEVRPILERVDALRQRSGQPWLPENIEVGLGNYENARGHPVDWPAEWPGLYDPTTRKRGDFYRVLVPAKDFTRLTAFIEATTEQRRPILVDLNWMHATVQFRFPGDQLWLGR